MRSVDSLALAGALVVAPACADQDGEHGPVVQLSEEAEPIYALMRWTGEGVPATAGDAATLSGVDPPADPIAVEAAVVALAGEVYASSRFDPLTGSLHVDTLERDILPGPDLVDEQLLVDGVT